MSVEFQTFYSGGMFSSAESCLQDACEQAARFTESLAPDAVLGFAQALPQANMAYVTVWFRTDVGTNDEDPVGE